MSDHRPPPAGSGEPVLWTPPGQSGGQSGYYSNGPQTAYGAVANDPRQMAAPSFGQRGQIRAPAGSPPSYPAQTEYAATSGTHPLWSAVPPTTTDTPVPAQDPAPETPRSLLDRFKSRASEDGSVPRAGARKPFLIGLLTGIVGTLLIGQIFSASKPTPDYSYAPPPATETPPDTSTEGESALTFLDRVEQSSAP